MTRIVGLSGGIGSGKSTVADMFRKRGAEVLCADTVVHELQAAGAPMLAELAAAFGAEILNEDGSLNRAALGERVFRDASERARLNAIVHPAFGVDFDRRIALLVESNVEMLVLDIPLLFEGRSSGQGYAARRHFDATVLVWVPEALQVERTMSRDGSTEEQARLRIQAQMPLSEKRELADHVILNDGTLADTEAQVQEVFRKLRLLPTRETSQEKP